jgi:hypothetical protein
LSTPFSLRFDSLLERLSEHKGLFDVDLRAGRHASLEAFIKKVTRDLADRERFIQDSEVKQYLENGKRIRDRKCLNSEIISLFYADNVRGFSGKHP